MKEILQYQLNNKNLVMPIFTFPCAKKLNINVNDIVSKSKEQYKIIKYIEENCPVSIVCSSMDLSVEAEAFGAKIKFSPEEVPTVIETVLKDVEDINSLQIPIIGEARTSIYIDAIKKAKNTMRKPVFAGVIGPFSLAGRLMDMTEVMINCYNEPEFVHKTVEKCSIFIKNYIIALKNAGADGVVMAEPAAGLLSPILCEEFSSNYVKKIVSEIQEDSFIFVYHNCGNVVPLYKSLIDINADIYHFGNAIDIEEMLKIMPEDKLIMGNINPILIKDGTKETIETETISLLKRCSKYKNYVMSTGCDLPPATSWENIMYFFNAIEKFYKG